MIRRLSVSVGQPSRIGMYMKDKLWITLVFILIVSVLCSIPSIIKVSTYKGFDTNTVSTIGIVYENSKNANTENYTFLPNVQIKDYKLVGTETGGFNYETFGISINGKFPTYMYDLCFLEDKVEILMGGITLKSYTYEELKLDNVDIYNLDSNDEDFVQVINALEYIFIDNKSIWTTVEITVSLVSNIISHFVIALIIALLISIGNFIPYKYVFKLSLYGVTISQIFRLLATLFEFNILNFVGFVLAFIFMKKAMRNIIAIKKKVG